MARKYKEKVIIVDMDDTVVDFLGFLCGLHNKLYDTCITPSNITEYNFDHVLFKDARGVTVKGDSLRETFLEYEPHGLYARLPALRYADKAMRHFKEKGYKLIILTARKAEYEKQTIMNLLMNDIPYDEIIFCPSEEKAKKIRELSKTYNIQMFVDDKASTIEEVSEIRGINHIVMINKSHNRDIEMDEDVIRHDELIDCVRYLKDLTEK